MDKELEKAYTDLMLASTVEILTLPIFWWIGVTEGVLFWVVLLLLDSFLLKRMPFFAYLHIMVEPNYKKERNTLYIMSSIFFVGLAIIAFRSLPLAGALLLNDIVVDFLAFMNAMNEKKNK